MRETFSPDNWPFIRRHAATDVRRLYVFDIRIDKSSIILAPYLVLEDDSLFHEEVDDSSLSLPETSVAGTQPALDIYVCLHPCKVACRTCCELPLDMITTVICAHRPLRSAE